MRLRGRDWIAVNALSELFKQKQYNPILVEEQVAVMWADAKMATSIQLPVERVKEYQLKLQDWLQTRKGALLGTIRREKGDRQRSRVAIGKAALDEFKTIWR